MKKVKAIKYFRIAQPPNMLTIQLKRFQFGLFGGGKINRPVYYPDVLDLKPFVATKEKVLTFACRHRHVCCVRTLLLYINYMLSWFMLVDPPNPVIITPM